MRSFSVILLSFACVTARSVLAQRDQPRAENVIIVTMDGVRWQEVFGGAQRELMSAATGGVADTVALAKHYFGPTVEARRELLMPFLWGKVARQGWILGDSASGSTVRVTNGKRFSYPGYNELLTGSADPRIDSNDKVPNPNVTVLEWLDKRPAFHGRVAAYGSWDVLPFILNVERSRLASNGDGPPVVDPKTPSEILLNAFAADLPPYWGNVRFDAVTMQGALNYLKTATPRVLYVMLGDTDEWAHERRYDLYLDAAQRGDRFIKTLWETVQSLPAYKDKTALLIATDHGRGSAPTDWTDHGRDVPASDRIWMAGMGPLLSDQAMPASGNFTQSQFAATIAMLLDLEEAFRRENPKAARAVKLGH